MYSSKTMVKKGYKQNPVESEESNSSIRWIKSNGEECTGTSSKKTTQKRKKQQLKLKGRKLFPKILILHQRKDQEERI